MTSPLTCSLTSKILGTLLAMHNTSSQSYDRGRKRRHSWKDDPAQHEPMDLGEFVPVPATDPDQAPRLIEYGDDGILRAKARAPVHCDGSVTTTV